MCISINTMILSVKKMLYRLTQPRYMRFLTLRLLLSISLQPKRLSFEEMPAKTPAACPIETAVPVTL